MTKLTDTQLIVLSSACRRDDGLALRPDSLKPAGAAKLVVSLVAKGFVREIRAKADAPVWREDESGRFALKILKAGREAIGVEEDGGDGLESARPVEPSKTIAPPSPRRSGKAPAVDIVAPKRGSSKRTLVISLLERPQGAAMDDLITATDWLPHTTRAFLSGLRKGGLNIALSKSEKGRASVYRIVTEDVAAAA